MTELFSAEQVEEISLMLLKWAYRKTGSRTEAEELAQEVWLQLYEAAHREEPIRQPQHLLWKIAHHVWCRRLRKAAYFRCLPADELPLASQEPDVAHQTAEEAEKAYFLQKMRKRLMELNHLQREMMIRFYLENQSQQEIAHALSVSVSTVKWHLFDTRRKLKEDLSDMTNGDFVYRPGKLQLAICGECDNYETLAALGSSMSKQNICILCYREAKTAEELSKTLGLPMAYVEDDLDFMIRHELMKKEGNAFRTDFLIESQEDRQAYCSIYFKMKTELSDVMVKGLLDAEEKIRSIGFLGSDQPMEKLLWLFIYQLSSRIRGIHEEEDFPLHPDGGRYYLLGYDTRPCEHKAVNMDGWMINGPMYMDGFTWFGLQCFGHGVPEKLFGEHAWERKKKTLATVLNEEKTLPMLGDEQRDDVAELVEKGFLRMEGEKLVPAFCVFTKEQYSKLLETVFQPIEKQIEESLHRLDQQLEALCRKNVPSIAFKQAYRMARYELSVMTTFFACEDGYLYVPGDVEDGEMLTLMYERP